MEDKTQTENVTNRLILGLHIFDIDDLRSHIAWCAASDKQILICV